MVTEKVKGMTKSSVMKLTLKDIVSMLGTPLTPSRVKCATLSLEVLQKALVFYGSKRSQS
jgi:NifU-like protein involved in Fe-S cluster formation